MFTSRDLSTVATVQAQQTTKIVAYDFPDGSTLQDLQLMTQQALDLFVGMTALFDVSTSPGVRTVTVSAVKA